MCFRYLNHPISTLYLWDLQKTNSYGIILPTFNVASNSFPGNEKTVIELPWKMESLEKNMFLIHGTSTVNNILTVFFRERKNNNEISVEDHSFQHYVDALRYYQIISHETTVEDKIPRKEYVFGT